MKSDVNTEEGSLLESLKDEIKYFQDTCDVGDPLKSKSLNTGLHVEVIMFDYCRCTKF